MANILRKQMDIISEFEAFDDWESRYKHLIAIGRQLPPLDEQHRQDINTVRGCSSTVWLVAEQQEGLVHFQADSDALIVRGLIALLLRVYSGQPAKDILMAEPAFIEELGLNTHLSANRANGLAAMVQQIRAYALALSNS